MQQNGARAPVASEAVGPEAGSPIVLGQSAVDLFGPWRFHIGDDPQWSGANFDDAGWEQVSLRSPDDSAQPDLGASLPVTGWTAQGHPEHAGYAWYRLRVNVEGAKGRLALKMPDGFDDAYEVFVNGRKIGHFGFFGRHRVLAYSSQPRGFRLPADLRDGPMIIAIRMWMDPATRFSVPDAGGLHGPPMLGLAPAIDTEVRVDWDDVSHDIGSGFLETLVLLLALGVSLTHFWLDRSDRAYLWLGLVALTTLLGNLILLLVNFTTMIPQVIATLSREAVLTPVRIGLWVIFWAAWFGLGPPAWLRRSVWGLVAVLVLGTAMLRPPLHGEVIPLHASVFLVPLTLWVKLALAGLLIWVAYRGIRENRTDGLLALPIIVLAIFANYQHELRFLHIPITFSLWNFNFSLGQISTMASLLLVTLLASRRFLLAQRQKVQWQLEIEQARELQSVLIPRTLPPTPGLDIESEYRPSREVGGDFFQIIPDPRDSSVLIIVGDVTGKGLRAGMLVALIVGAIDLAARQSVSPAQLLSMLNGRLCARGYATATCLVLRIQADGSVLLTNAGHLPPYLNGKEIDMDGALPLGTLPDADCTEVAFQLQAGDTLTLFTDGVVEAQDKQGKLFGFDRMSAMIAEHCSPSQIADAAQNFGQEDDILVLRLKRTVDQGRLTAVA